MFQRTILALSLVFAFMIITGCSSQTNPATPAGDVLSGHPLVGQPQVGQPLVGVSDRFPDGSPASGMGALGIFNLSVNADEISAELTPLRQNSLTDVLEVVDITNFLMMAPCYDCVKIGSISIDIDGNLVVSIGIKHPFPAGDVLKPISGKNRGDLHVFNVEGTIVSNSTATSFPGLGKSTAGFTLVNADGFTPYLDTVLDDIYPTDASVHPYILHFNDYTAGNFDALNPMGFESVTDPPPSGNLVMAMGCDYDYKDYVFNINDTFDFIYAVGCTYAVSSEKKNERFAPEYRVPQHNKKAASEVSVEIITNNLAEGDIASTANIEIHVVDISHGIAVGANIDEMLADSSVTCITIEVPGVEASTVIVDVSSPTGTGHDPSDPLVYTAAITNTAIGVEGTYTGLVQVLDSYSTGLNESSLLNRMDGIKRVDPIETPLTGLFEIDEFATYLVFTIDILNVNIEPVADAVVTGQVYASGEGALTFDATSSYDPDGSVDLYEWDFNDDGLFDDTGDEYSGDPWNPTHNFIVGDCYDVQLRVTDNASATDELDSPLTVCPFKNITLREGVNISDVGTIMNTDEVLVLFDDHQVWKYDNDMNNGALHFTMPQSDKDGRRLAASKNGDSICGWWDSTEYHSYSYYYDGTLAQNHSTSWYPNHRPPFNFDVTVTYSTLWVPPGSHNLVGMFCDVYGEPAWIRAGYGPSDYYGWFSNYNTNLGAGAGRIDINYLKGVQALGSTAYWNLFYLEGDPEWRVEKSYILIGFTTGWGGTQTDDDSGFWNPQDITSDSNDMIFVVDILSTGQRVIKKFSTTGTPQGSFGDNATMAVDPKRIDGSFSNDWLYVTMDDTISIFFPSEQD